MSIKNWFKKDKADVQHFKNQLVFLLSLSAVLFVLVLACELVEKLS